MTRIASTILTLLSLTAFMAMVLAVAILIQS
jgi:hypothetical protein